MHFSILKTAVATLAVCSEVVLGQAGPKIVADLETLTDKSQDVMNRARDISTVNIVLTGTPGVVTGLRDIVTLGMKAQPEWSEVTDAAEADAVFEAYRGFATVHQAAMTTLIGKSGIIGQLGLFSAPLAAVLRADESLVDTISFGLQDLVKPHAADIKKLAGPLTDSIVNAQKAYGA